MNWIRRNLFFVIGAAIVIGLGALYRHRKSAAEVG